MTPRKTPPVCSCFFVHHETLDRHRVSVHGITHCRLLQAFQKESKGNKSQSVARSLMSPLCFMCFRSFPLHSPSLSAERKSRGGGLRSTCSPVVGSQPPNHILDLSAVSLEPACWLGLACPWENGKGKGGRTREEGEEGGKRGRRPIPR